MVEALINVADEYTDPFGNGNRYFTDVKEGIKKLDTLYTIRGEITDKAREYAEKEHGK